MKHDGDDSSGIRLSSKAMKFEILDYKVKSPKPAIWSKATK